MKILKDKQNKNIIIKKTISNYKLYQNNRVNNCKSTKLLNSDLHKINKYTINYLKQLYNTCIFKNILKIFNKKKNSL